MRHSRQIDSQPSPARVARRGFSFTELLFAVMIMGIGFILIAAIFPAGLSQTKSNYDESVAASTARAAVATIGKLATSGNLPTTAVNEVQPLQRTLTGSLRASRLFADTVGNNMISPADPRYAWVGLYHRPTAEARAQVFVFVLNRSTPFTVNDFASTGATPTDADNKYRDESKLVEPRRVLVDCNPDFIEITSITAGPPRADEGFNPEALAPGAFVLISNPNIGVVVDAARFTGAVYRVGDRLPDGPGGEIRYSYLPGNAFVAETTVGAGETPVAALTNATGYVIGRNRTGLAAGQFDGNVMDVAFYTTFVALQ